MQRFRLASTELLWRWWGDDFVVFDASTGGTHLLDSVAGHVVMALRDAEGLTVDALFDAVFAGDAAAGEPSMRAEERAALTGLLEQLQALDLLESGPV